MGVLRPLNSFAKFADEISRRSAPGAADDLSGSGFEPSQTDSITSPAIRWFNPRAMVSTSGNSGMVEGFQIVELPECPEGAIHFSAVFSLQYSIRNLKSSIRNPKSEI